MHEDFMKVPPVLIFFDATPLALWEQADIHKVGIGRMATRTLRALLLRDDVHVELVCPCGMEEFVQRFQAKNNWACKADVIAIAQPPRRGRFLHLKEWAKKLGRKLLAPLPSKLQGGIKRLAKVCPFASYARPDKTLRKVVSSRLPAQGVAVWFSCFQPIPESIAHIPGLQTHVVLHDIIPLRLTSKHPFQAPCLDLMNQHLQKADVIWANSQFTRSDFLEYFSAEHKNNVYVALHGGGDHFRPSCPEQITASLTMYGVPEQDPYFVCLATLEPRKGLSIVIKAFKRLAEKRTDIHLILIGQNGWNCGKILREGAETGRIHLTGFASDQTVAALLTGCHGFLYMSEYEGFGLPVLEAMSCGAPVIAAASTSLLEVADNAAILVPPGDVASLSRNMLRLLDDPELRADLRHRGLIWAPKFTWKRFVETILRGIKARKEESTSVH